MKRLCVVALICVLPAAVLTVAVAWLCAIRQAGSASIPVTSLSREQIIEKFNPRHAPEDLRVGAPTLYWREGALEMALIGYEYPAWIAFRSGWPMPCFMAEATSKPPGTTAATPWIIYDAIEIDSSTVLAPGTVLPTRLLPGPFLVNTLVNIGSLVGLYLLLPWNRYHCARRRCARGCCPACAFDLRSQLEGDASDAIRCPECFVAVSPERFEPRFWIFRWWMLGFAIPSLILIVRTFVTHQPWADLVTHWRLEPGIWPLANRVGAIALIGAIIFALALKHGAVRPSRVQFAILAIVALVLSTLGFLPLIVFADLLVERLATV